jgi:hypothetical protein
MWLRSRERQKAVQSTKNCCTDCGIKGSVAKGREVKIQVHHDPEINWDGVIDLIEERILRAPQYPLCESCHDLRHGKESNAKKKKD